MPRNTTKLVVSCNQQTRESQQMLSKVNSKDAYLVLMSKALLLPQVTKKAPIPATMPPSIATGKRHRSPPHHPASSHPSSNSTSRPGLGLPSAISARPQAWRPWLGRAFAVGGCRMDSDHRPGGSI